MTALRLPTGLLEELPPYRSASLSEATLMRGYGAPATRVGPVLRTEPCACGGVVEQHLGEAPEDAVNNHNATRDHRDWRDRREA